MKNKNVFLGVFIFFMTLTTLQAAPFKLNSSEYQQMLDKTIMTTGNNARMKKVLAKVRNGEKIRMAAFGGSVTEGAGPAKFTDGYAYQFFRAFKAKYAPGDGSNVYFNDAGLSGTGSLLGILRYQSDLVEVSGGAPDLLIVEFAVNDNGDLLCQRSFEAIVRRALSENPDCALIALYSAAGYGNTSSQKKPVADFYSLPQINMLQLVNDSIENKVFSKEAYYTDNVHPTLEGHQLMCDCLMNLVDKMDKEKAEAAAALPAETFKPRSLEKMIRIFPDNKDPDVVIDCGDFTETDRSCQTLKKTNSSNFPKNWKKKLDAKSENIPFEMELTCRSFLFVYKVQASGSAEKFGKAELYVDGHKLATYDGGKQGGWNNCEPNMIFDGDRTAKHTITVKMAPGSEKLAFTIVAMGYTK